MGELTRKMQRGDSYDPPAFCTICRYELYHQVPHVCDLPIEGTPAFYDPKYEQQWMEKRSDVLRHTVPVYTVPPEDENSWSIALTDQPLDRPMLTTKTLPTYEDFERMLEEWHTDPCYEGPVYQYMGITLAEYFFMADYKR